MFKSSAVLSAFLSISAGTVMATEPGEIIPASEPGLIDADDLIDFASHYWHWYDTGVFSQEALSWTPSNPDVVRLDTHFFHEALVIFEDIYAGSLNNDLGSVNYYPIDDLLTDDPSVMSQFRAFTETGILTTRSGPTSSETINHLLLILTATTANDPCTSLR